MAQLSMAWLSIQTKRPMPASFNLFDQGDFFCVEQRLGVCIGISAHQFTRLQGPTHMGCIRVLGLKL
jgi:hypothetical protein